METDDPIRAAPPLVWYMARKRTDAPVQNSRPDEMSSDEEAVPMVPTVRASPFPARTPNPKYPWKWSKRNYCKDMPIPDFNQNLPPGPVKTDLPSFPDGLVALFFPDSLVEQIAGWTNQRAEIVITVAKTDDKAAASFYEEFWTAPERILANLAAKRHHQESQDCQEWLPVEDNKASHDGFVLPWQSSRQLLLQLSRSREESVANQIRQTRESNRTLATRWYCVLNL